MIRYQMFEKEITYGNHVSYHFCVDKFGNNFNINSKHFDIDQELSKIQFDSSKYECSITTSNTTSSGDYFHISYLNRDNDYIDRKVLKTFNVNVGFPVIYFTKKFPIDDMFKCGFHLNTYKTFKSKFFSDVLKTIKLFKGLYCDIILAADFSSDGKFVDDSINIEIVPIQTKETFYRVKQILLDNFNIDILKINLYDKLFSTYTVDCFSWHIKIKLQDNTCVKFYRTYPNNPYLNYKKYNDH